MPLKMYMITPEGHMIQTITPSFKEPTESILNACQTTRQWCKATFDNCGMPAFVWPDYS